MNSSNPQSLRRPAIVAPVMRVIGVADAARTAAFYREVLEFEVREAPGEPRAPAVVEAVRGPARIQFSTQDQTRPREPAIVFFQTDDVAAMHAAVTARGGHPARLEKVNWIKMRIFEIRDPDGHTLWFGQSYQEPDMHSPRRMLRQIMPELPLDNVPAGVAYYCSVLGFSVNYQQHDLGVMDRDDVRVLLIARSDRHKGIGSAYVYVENADALFADLQSRGANVQGEPVSHPWGLRDFRVLDLEGNQITFGQPFE